MLEMAGGGKRSLMQRSSSTPDIPTSPQSAARRLYHTQAQLRPLRFHSSPLTAPLDP